MSPHVSLPDLRVAITKQARNTAWRRSAALLLQRTSLALERAAQRLVAMQSAVPCAQATELPHIEFHAEAGALEGALFIDGEFVGTLRGVTRL